MSPFYLLLETSERMAANKSGNYGSGAQMQQKWSERMQAEVLRLGGRADGTDER